MGKTRKKVKKTRKYAPEKHFIKKKTISERVRLVKRSGTRKRNMQTNATRRVRSKGGGSGSSDTKKVEDAKNKIEGISEEDFKNELRKSLLDSAKGKEDSSDTRKYLTGNTFKSPKELRFDGITKNLKKLNDSGMGSIISGEPPTATAIGAPVSGTGDMMGEKLTEIKTLIEQLNGKATGSNANYPECPGKQRELIIKITSAGGNCVQAVGFKGLDENQPNASSGRGGGGGEDNSKRITKQQVQTFLNRNLNSNDAQSGGGFQNSFNQTLDDQTSSKAHQTRILDQIKTDIKTYLDKEAREMLTRDYIKQAMKKDGSNNIYNIPLDLYIRRGLIEKGTLSNLNLQNKKSYIETVSSENIITFIDTFVDNLNLTLTDASIDRSVEKMINYKSGNSNPTNCIVYSRKNDIEDTDSASNDKDITGSFHNNLFSLETSPLLCYIVRHIYDLDQGGKALYSKDELLKYNERTMSRDLNENSVNKYNAIMFYIQLTYDNTNDDNKKNINNAYELHIKNNEIKNENKQAVTNRYEVTGTKTEANEPIFSETMPADYSNKTDISKKIASNQRKLTELRTNGTLTNEMEKKLKQEIDNLTKQIKTINSEKIHSTHNKDNVKSIKNIRSFDEDQMEYTKTFDGILRDTLPKHTDL